MSRDERTTTSKRREALNPWSRACLGLIGGLLIIASLGLYGSPPQWKTHTDDEGKIKTETVQSDPAVYCVALLGLGVVLISVAANGRRLAEISSTGARFTEPTAEELKELVEEAEEIPKVTDAELPRPPRTSAKIVDVEGHAVEVIGSRSRFGSLVPDAEKAGRVLQPAAAPNEKVGMFEVEPVNVDDADEHAAPVLVLGSQRGKIAGTVAGVGKARAGRRDKRSRKLDRFGGLDVGDVVVFGELAYGAERQSSHPERTLHGRCRHRRGLLAFKVNVYDHVGRDFFEFWPRQLSRSHVAGNLGGHGERFGRLFPADQAGGNLGSALVHLRIAVADHAEFRMKATTPAMQVSLRHGNLPEQALAFRQKTRTVVCKYERAEAVESGCRQIIVPLLRYLVPKPLA